MHLSIITMAIATAHFHRRLIRPGVLMDLRSYHATGGPFGAWKRV